jgi:hypothetical protein
MKRWIAAAALAAVFACAGNASARDSVLLWTAPGDDGMVGRATRYDLRYKSVNIAGTDTLGWWNAAGAISTPIPAAAGVVDSAVVTGLGNGAYYFVIVAVDDAGNRSNFSNVAILDLLDVIKPAPIGGLIARPR